MPTAAPDRHLRTNRLPSVSKKGTVVQANPTLSHLMISVPFRTVCSLYTNFEDDCTEGYTHGWPLINVGCDFQSI